MGKKLSERQNRFIDYYLELGNATDAARKAGYKGNNLNKIASENLTKLDIYIKERLQGKEDERIADQDEVLRTITDILRNQESSDKDRLKAAELMGKRHGLFKDKVEHSGAIEYRWKNNE